MIKDFILIVEDNEDDEMLILRSLRKNNVINETVVVRDGAEALDFLFCRGAHAGRDPENQPAVILLDIMLPKCGGLEVLREIRKRETTKLIPVVILTSSKEERDLVDSYELGANSYVRKPVDFREFSSAVNQMGLYWLILNEKPVLKRGNA